MRSFIGSICTSRWLVAIACSVALINCSEDDPSRNIGSLQGQGGSAGSSSGSGGSGGSAGSGGASNVARGGSGGGNAGGSGGEDSAAAGSAGSAGAAGSAGSAGSSAEPDAADAGVVPDEPDAAEPVDPDDEDPVAELVTFSDVFPLLVAECGNCHGANAPGARPRFAVANNEAASFDATELMSQGQLVSARIVARAVTLRTMPTGCNGGAFGTGNCLTQEQADLLQQWLNDGALP